MRPLHGARLAEDDPWVDLLALPLALLFGLLFSLFGFSSLLTALIQIQFHELGHALCAWLSSRAALPLPFGFTFVSEQPSAFVTLCMTFLLGLFTYRSLRERRSAAACAGVAALLVLASLRFCVTPEQSGALVTFGGYVGELGLTAAAMALFYLRLPDRLRWDFFRFLALPPSAAAWLLALRTWRGIARGEVALPTRSFLPGDGASDFDRLLAHGFTSGEIVGTVTKLGNATMVVLALVYVMHAQRALRRLRGRPERPW